MSSTTQSAPVYVQQAFSWDDCDAKSNVVPKSPAFKVSSPKKPRPSKRTPMNVPTFSQTTSVRRGRCEHVGGILASVLEKYGIGIDQLIAEIEKSGT